MIKQKWVVENLDSKNFFLRLENLLSDPAFTKDIDFASNYESEELCELIIKNLLIKGFKMRLKPRQLKISYVLV